MASKKIKKLLKTVAPMLAIAGLGKVFMANRNRNAMLEGADANDGFLNSMIGKVGRKRSVNPAEFLIGVGDDPGGAMLDGYPIQAGAKKGGRIVKTKRGGRAVRKAKRSKKK